ncbi:hypothetical protein J1614_004461 [Plenodomus biglobosus]|nr:hypothetical protein J1614_004461 [Plenodomus biglobosus]
MRIIVPESSIALGNGNCSLDKIVLVANGVCEFASQNGLEAFCGVVESTKTTSMQPTRLSYISLIANCESMSHTFQTNTSRWLHAVKPLDKRLDFTTHPYPVKCANI